MAISEFGQGARFIFKDKVWTVTGASVDKIHLKSEDGDISSVPRDCDIQVYPYYQK